MTALRNTARRWYLLPITVGALFCLAFCVAPVLIATGALERASLPVEVPTMQVLGLSLLAVGVIGLMRHHRTANADNVRPRRRSGTREARNRTDH